MIHKDYKRCVLLYNKVSFGVKRENYKQYCSLFFFCLVHVMKNFKKSIDTKNDYVANICKCILNLLVIHRIQSICELILGIEGDRRTIP